MEQKKREEMDKKSSKLMEELRELGTQYRKSVDTLQKEMKKEIKELSNQHAKKISEVHQDFIDNLISVAFR